MYGVEFPPAAKVGRELVIRHRGFGLVVSGRVRIGDRVTLYQGVTIGEADVQARSIRKGPIIIGNDVILGAGAKVLSASSGLTVHDGCIIGGNSVLLNSTTGPNEIWVGAPAVKKAMRH